MIVEIEKGAGFKGVIDYVLNDKEDGIENRAEIIGGNVFGDTSSQLAKHFAYAQKNKSKYKGKGRFTPVRHIYFNPDDLDGPLNDETIQEITDSWMQEMGFTDVPFLLVKHQDENTKGKVHWHVITSNYKLSNRQVNEHYSQKKNNNVCRGLERKFNLNIGEGLAQNKLWSGAYDKEKLEAHNDRRRNEPYAKAIKSNHDFGDYFFKKIYQQKIQGVKFCKKYNPDVVKTGMKTGETITDRKKVVSCSTNGSEISQDTVMTMVQIAKSKGFTSVKATGEKEFLLKAWEALDQAGIPIKLNDGQEDLFNEFQQQKIAQPVEQVQHEPDEAEAKAPAPKNTGRKRRRRKRTNGYKPSPVNRSAHEFDRKKKREEQAKADEAKALKKKHDEFWESYNSNEYSSSGIDHDDDGGSPPTPARRRGHRM